jgi:hypothetical protein
MMRPLGIGLAIVVMVSAVAGAAAAAASKDTAATDAPPLLQQKGIPCAVTNARTIVKDADLADGAKASFYEVACQGGLGYVVIKRSKEPLIQAEDCLLASKPGADGKPNKLACKLPENADPNGILSAVIAKQGRDCKVEKVRGIGQTPSQGIIETSCQGGAGYILMLPIANGAETSANPCIGYDEVENSPIKCELSTPAQREDAIKQLLASAGKPCTLSKHHFIGTTPEHSDYLEIACTEGKGYVLETDASGKYKAEIDCAMAAGIAGGCTLTDTRAAQTEQSGTYSKLAKKAGFNCDVSKYAAFAVDKPGLDVVELQCGNRPDGGIGIFPANGAGHVLDCIRAQTEGYKCTYTKDADVYPQLFAQLKAKGKTTCQVNGARGLGKTAEGEQYVEVACADGGPGWVLDYPPNADQPSTLLNCTQAAGLGSGCQLPTNVKK